MIQFQANFYNTKNKTTAFQLLSYKRMAFTRETKNFLHSHSFAELFFITGGEGFFHTRNGKVKIEKGMIVINNPSVEHYETSSTEKPLSYALFAIGGVTFTAHKNADVQVAENLPKDKAQTFFFDFSAYYTPFYDVLGEIEAESSQKKPYWETAFFSEFNKFLIFILRKSPLSPTPYYETVKRGSLAPAFAYIRARYPEDLSLDFLANICKLNKYYLSHAFKKKFGLSPIQYLNKMRCEEAKKLLETTDLSIAEIAVQVGYNSISHFSEMYKKTMGEAPIVTRKKFSNP